MDTEKAILDIRSLISASEMEAAINQTRQLLSEKQLEAELVQLDMVESEWNAIQDQHINGILSVDDQMRLQNISRARLMKLLLQIGGDGELADNLTPKTVFAADETGANRNQKANQAFKDGLKNLVGVGLLLPTLGALTEQKWGLAVCFGLAGLVTFLPSLRFIEKSVRYELLSWHKYMIVIGALLLAGALYVPKDTAAKNGPAMEVGK